MRYHVATEELEVRILKNEARLCEPYYRIENVYQSPDADWAGDKEGRALLAFVSHYCIHGRKIPCMEEMLSSYDQKANEMGYLGACDLPYIYEQQLSGHSWLLRGFAEYYEVFGGEAILSRIERIVQNLYLPLLGKMQTYPIARGEDGGGVSGNSLKEVNGWLLSTDVGCAFMSIDGLSHAYALLREKGNSIRDKLYSLLIEMIDRYDSIDKAALKAQTHCTLTAARGMMRMAHLTGDDDFVRKAARIFELYVTSGMSLTYQNLNWWSRPNTWTEPCAIVDSLMLALSLYAATGDARYRTDAARIFHNGFATMQRANGGAGTDSVVIGDEKKLYCKSYEASFCCTMRLAEGLRIALENKDILYAEMSGEVKKDGAGRYMDGDILYCAIENEEALSFADHESKRDVDGRTLYPLLKFYRIPDSIMRNTALTVVFE